MISRFHVKNFRSIVDLDLSLLYGEGKAPGGYKEMPFMPFLEGKTERYVPCLAMYGANGSGKTNIVEAMFIYTGLVLGRVQASNSAVCNKLHPELTETELEMEWSDGHDLFTYGIAFDDTGVTAERFFFNKELLYEIGRATPHFEPLIRPEYTEDKLKAIFDVECVSSESRRQVSPLLPKLVHNLPGLHPALTRAFFTFVKRTAVYIGVDHPAWLAFDELERASNDSNREALRGRVFDLVKRFDLGIKDIKHQREFRDRDDKSPDWVTWSSIRKGDRIQQDSISTFHTDINGHTVQFDIREESLGTRKLISLFCLIVAALEEGGALVIDEIDRSLHPLILREIVRLFKSREHNKKQAQLIFTTHATDLLEGNLLRVSEVAIVNKNLVRGTTVSRFSDNQELRNGADFRKRYLEGAFRGIPFPYI